MAPLPPLAQSDPTLDAVDAALVARQHSEAPRTYLGFSIIGHPCSRRLWYDYHLPGTREVFDAATLKRFASGHAGEAVMADRLRMVEGITLLTIDPETGRQWRHVDFDGQFAGHMDGAIHGLLQCPTRWSVWEHKNVGDKKQSQLAALKEKLGEKSALQAWDEIYYAQAVLYMDYSGMERHYLTCSTPGERTTISVRTNADPAAAALLKDKAKRILTAKVPLAKLSNDPSWWQCKFCHHHARCHGA